MGSWNPRKSKSIFHNTALLLPLLLGLGVFGWQARLAAQSEDLGRRYYQSARLFYQRGDYDQALKDWQFILENLPESLYADDALLDMGRYYLEIKEDAQQAMTLFRRIIEKYAEADKAPAAYYYLGRILARFGRTRDDLDDALANFERVMLLYPQSQWSGNAATEAGHLYWLLGQPVVARATCRKALRTVQERATLVNAWLCIARSYAAEGRWPDAFDAVARIQQIAQTESEIQLGIDAATALYRLQLRPETHALPYYSDPNFRLSRQIKLDDPRRLVLDPARGFGIIDVDLKWILWYDPTGKYLDRQTFSRLKYATTDTHGRLYVVTGAAVIDPVRGRHTLSYRPRPDKLQKVEPKTLAADAAGRIWVSTGDRGIFMFKPTPEGRLEREATPLEKVMLKPKRLLLDPWQRLWVLQDRSPYISILFRDGNSALTLQYRQYRPKKPVAVGWDILGFIYVLDQDPPRIAIFSPLGAPTKTVNLRNLMEKAKPLDMVVWPDGSVYLLDRSAKTVYHLI